MAEIRKTRRIFNKKAIRVGNSAGVLLPKSLLGADVRVIVLHPAINIKRDTLRFLESVIEDILGIYLIKENQNEIEILAISTKVNRHIKKGKYEIDVVPFSIFKKSLKEKSETREKLKQAKVVMNKKLLAELQKEI